MGQRILKDRLAAALLLAIVVLVGLGGSARAGQYHVYSCRMPDGETAPTDGWVGSVAAGGAWDQYAEDSCKSGGALVAALGDATTHLSYLDRATWAFEAPSNERLAGAMLFRAGYVHGLPGEEAAYEFWISAPLTTTVIEECVYTLNCQNKGELAPLVREPNEVIVPAKSLGSRLFLSVGCGAGGAKSECKGTFGDPSSYAAVIYLYAADLTLEQTAGPTANGASGELVSGTAVGGVSDVTFNASDPGAGIYEAVFSVDGKVVQSTVIDEAGGRCRNVGQTTDGLPAFLEIRPCPSSVNADVGFDTTRIANGLHHLVVSVLDAAGNSAPVLDRNVDVENPGAPRPPNGLGASQQASLIAHWQSTRRATLETGYGHAETIRGRLTAVDGSPISGAQIDLTARPASSGAKEVAMKASHTHADGRFALQVPAGASSRTIRLAYRARLGDPKPVVSTTLRLAVRASLSLAISPRTASAGSTIHFRGRLRGMPIPIRGKSLVLEARSGGPWIEFDVIHSDRSGRYRAGYTFKFPGPATYQFRVLCEEESDYPFSTGSSSVVEVAEH